MVARNTPTTRVRVKYLLTPNDRAVSRTSAAGTVAAIAKPATPEAAMRTPAILT